MYCKPLRLTSNLHSWDEIAFYGFNFIHHTIRPRFIRTTHVRRQGQTKHDGHGMRHMLALPFTIRKKTFTSRVYCLIFLTNDSKNKLDRIYKIPSHCKILYIKANMVVSVRHRHSQIVAMAVGSKSSTYVRPSIHPSVFLSFFLSFYVSIRPSLGPSVHPSFFPSLTSPSSLAPFSFIYISLVSFSGNHVIGLLSMCSNVRTTAYLPKP